MVSVALISHTHPSITLGGGEIAAHRQFTRLRELGHDAHFVGMTIDPNDSRRMFGQHQRVISMGPNDDCLRGDGMDGFLMEHKSLADEDWLVDYLLSLKSEIYHFHHFWNIGAGVIRRLRAARPDAKLVLTLHEFTAICAHHGQMVKSGSNALCHASGDLACSGCLTYRTPFDMMLRRQRLQHMLSLFDLLVSPSAFLRQRFIEWDVPPEKIVVIENGMPETPPPGAETADSLAGKARRFAYFGNATPTKGLDVLIRAAGLIQQRHVNGDPRVTVDVFGVTQSKIAELWPDLPLPSGLRFRGRYAPGDAVDLMRAYGWVVIPSIWWENSPVVIQEARAAGTPLIYSDLGGLAEKAAPFGVGFPVGDHFALADIMGALAADPDRLGAIKTKITMPLTVDGFLTEWAKALELELDPVSV